MAKAKDKQLTEEEKMLLQKAGLKGAFWKVIHRKPDYIIVTNTITCEVRMVRKSQNPSRLGVSTARRESGNMVRWVGLRNDECATTAQRRAPVRFRPGSPAACERSPRLPPVRKAARAGRQRRRWVVVTVGGPPIRAEGASGSTPASTRGRQSVRIRLCSPRHLGQVPVFSFFIQGEGSCVSLSARPGADRRSGEAGS